MQCSHPRARAQISAEAWQARLRAVIRKGSRYINPRFDVVWAAIAFMYAHFPRAAPSD